MNQHEILKNYTNMLLEGRTNSLVVKGSAGIGKTYSVLEALNEAGLEEEVHFIYITGFITPLQLFNTLKRSTTLENPKLFVFDDLEGITSNRNCVAILKSALWEARGRRVINYQSSSSKIDGDKSHNFDGKMLLILNNLKDETTLGKSLLDRGIFYEMKLSPAELTSYIEDILPLISIGKEDIKQEVWNRVKRFTQNDKFSLRSLTRAFEFYEYNQDKWWTLFLNTLSLTEEQRIFYSIKDENLPSVKAQADKFTVLTGKSAKTFQRLQKKL